MNLVAAFFQRPKCVTKMFHAADEPYDQSPTQILNRPVSGRPTRVTGISASRYFERSFIVAMNFFFSCITIHLPSGRCLLLPAPPLLHQIYMYSASHRQDCSQRSSAGIVITRGPIFRFFATRYTNQGEIWREKLTYCMMPRKM